jgi:hypothetical protein
MLPADFPSSLAGHCEDAIQMLLKLGHIIPKQSHLGLNRGGVIEVDLRAGQHVARTAAPVTGAQDPEVQHLVKELSH